MKINKIILNNIQSLKGQTVIELSPLITRISGNNNKGKSAVKKALEVFIRPFTSEDFKALVTKGQEEALVALELESKEIIACKITKNKTTYLRISNNEITQTWSSWSTEIPKILQWIVIEDEDLCINFKEPRPNLFVETKPTLNGKLVDKLMKDQNLLLRIENLKTKIEEVKAVNIQNKPMLNYLNQELNKRSYLSKENLLSINTKLEYHKNKIKKLDKLKKFVELSGLMREVELTSNKNKILIEEIIKFEFSKRYITTLSYIIQLNQLKKKSTKLDILYILKPLDLKYELIKINLDWNNIEKLNNKYIIAQNNIKMISLLDVKNNQKSLEHIKINSITEKINKFVKLKTLQITKERYLKQSNLEKQLNTIKGNIDNLITINDIINNTENRILTELEIIKTKEQLKEFSYCPLCNSQLSQN